jgi:Fe-Mn family superoxide dismutase
MYQEATFNLPVMTGLSNKQLEVHLKLYAGYVKNVNALEQKITELKADSATNALALSELTRRYAFEWNGMRLHEYYFEALGGNGEIFPSPLTEAITQTWGSVEAWQAEFQAMGVMRGIGWVLLMKDDRTGQLRNIWISDHELGHLAGGKVMLALDVWEHAFMVDYLPAERAQYIQAWFSNLNWQTVIQRF